MSKELNKSKGLQGVNDWGLDWLFYTLVFYFGVLLSFSVVTYIKNEKKRKKITEDILDYCNCPNREKEFDQIVSDRIDEREFFEDTKEVREGRRDNVVLILYMDKVGKDVAQRQDEEWRKKVSELMS